MSKPLIPAFTPEEAAHLQQLYQELTALKAELNSIDQQWYTVRQAADTAITDSGWAARQLFGMQINETTAPRGLARASLLRALCERLMLYVSQYTSLTNQYLRLQERSHEIDREMSVMATAGLRTQLGLTPHNPPSLQIVARDDDQLL